MYPECRRGEEQFRLDQSVMDRFNDGHVVILGQEQRIIISTQYGFLEMY